MSLNLLPIASQLKKILLCTAAFSFAAGAYAKNPIVANQGLNDPHIHIFGDTAYVYASHDKSIDNKDFIMEDWWVWSSKDLVEWQLESVLKPEQTYIGAPFTGAWATDVAYRNGKYYWYLSEKNEQTAVVVGDTPVGPWKDPLGKPMLKADLTPTHEYDISVIEDKGVHYIVFGVWDYYIARLNDDMISLAEKPRKIQINNPAGPYGKGTTDDKPSVHKYKDKFYLSWGAFYSMSNNVYGPYEYKGVILNETSFAPGYDKPTWPKGPQQGRHGNFFEWNNQTYFTYCDISQTGNRYFRDSFISYVHYKANGEMSPIWVDGIGVGEYDASKGVIEAENYFSALGTEKREAAKGFTVATKAATAVLGYQNIKALAGMKSLTLNLMADKTGEAKVEVRRRTADGAILGSSTFQAKANEAMKVVIDVPGMMNTETLFLVITPATEQKLDLDSLLFTK